ncbi:ATPase or kinase [Legionella drancourtii LLAP12]|uniref:tRNA threonylcarbamoyladenosine biosynthesis protein TsaE n=1 Tax=Legionella drancourtii LLAP12 TaxID=658187 RepID=G9ESF1_9GAMM|nr:ATPase or kinase [Legionella drancourtii LLAP12]
MNELNNAITFDLPNEQASEAFATCLASCLTPPLIITFCGDLGAGKTTIIRAMLRHLGIRSAIKSPTFSLVESYVCQNMPVHHFDLYRIQHEDELEYLGFRDYFTNESICCIEWAEKAGKALPKVDIRFKLNMKGAGREMQITTFSDTGKRILDRLAGEL